MGQLGISPWWIALAGAALWYLGYLAIRKKRITGSSGALQGTRDPVYYGKIAGSFFGGAVLFLVAVIALYEQSGWLAASLLVLLILGLAYAIYRLPAWRKQSKRQLRRMVLGEKRPAISSVRQWALATAAILSRVHGRDYQLLGGAPVSASATRRARRFLRRQWDIDDIESFEEIQDWLLESGHRMEFHELIDKISGLNDLAVEQYQAEVLDGQHGHETRIEQTEELDRVTLIRERGSAIKAHGFLAWDYLRYIDNCRLGYLAEYLEEEDAWDRIVSAAQVLQSRYDSWMDLGETFLRARAFWSSIEDRKSGKRYRKAFTRLLEDKKSPWNRLDWEMALYSRK